MFEYFMFFNNDLVVRVDVVFMKYIVLYGLLCCECVYLIRYIFVLVNFWFYLDKLREY